MSAIAKLHAFLGLNSAEFTAGMKKAKGDTSAFQSSIKQIGTSLAAAFSFGAIAAAAKSLAEYGAEMSEAAQNAGILTEEMFALNEIATQNGLSVDEMRRMLSKLQTELYNAADGSEESRKKFEAIGLEITDLAGMAPAQMFEEVARAAFKSGIPLQSIADIFGDRLGPKAVSALRQLAEEGLPAIDTAAATAADKLDTLMDKWDRLIAKVKEGSLSLGVKVAEGAQVAGSFVKGAAEQMSMAEKLARLSLAPLTFGASLIPTRKQREAGMQAAIETQNQQFVEEQQASDKRRKQINESRNAMRKKAIEGETERDSERRLKSREDYDKQREKEQSIIDAAASREENLREKLSDLTDPFKDSGPAQIRRDSLAQVGGFFGGDRAGFDVQSKQLHVQEESRRLLDEIRANTREMKEQLAYARGER